MPASKDKHFFSFSVSSIPYIASALFLVGLSVFVVRQSMVGKQSPATQSETQKDLSGDNPFIPLPSPEIRSNSSLEATLNSRRTRRSFVDESITQKQISQILWAGQGVVADWGERTTPSSKSVYPNTIYLLSHNIEKLDAGLYRYLPGDRQPLHQLESKKIGDFRDEIFSVVNQSTIKQAPAVVIIAANFGKMNRAYTSGRQDSTVYMEAGNIIQNINLQVENLKLGTLTISNFDQTKLHDTLGLPDDETIIALLPIGVPKE